MLKWKKFNWMTVTDSGFTVMVIMIVIVTVNAMVNAEVNAVANATVNAIMMFHGDGDRERKKIVDGECDCDGERNC